MGTCMGWSQSICLELPAVFACYTCMHMCMPVCPPVCIISTEQRTSRIDQSRPASISKRTARLVLTLDGRFSEYRVEDMVVAAAADCAHWNMLGMYLSTYAVYLAARLCGFTSVCFVCTACIVVCLVVWGTSLCVARLTAYLLSVCVNACLSQSICVFNLAKWCTHLSSILEQALVLVCL